MNESEHTPLNVEFEKWFEEVGKKNHLDKYSARMGWVACYAACCMEFDIASPAARLVFPPDLRVVE